MGISWWAVSMTMKRSAQTRREEVKGVTGGCLSTRGRARTGCCLPSFEVEEEETCKEELWETWN